MEDSELAQKATLGQGVQILQMIDGGSLDRKTAQAVIERRVSIGKSVPHPESAVFRVVVEYTLVRVFEDTDDQMFAFQGADNAVYEPIEECKGVSLETREVEFELLGVDKVHEADPLSLMMECEIIQKMGFRPALFRELMAFDLCYPNEKMKSTIWALGSVADEYNRPFIGHHKSGFGFLWFGECEPSLDDSFLVVRK